jgi:hypothetical protein
LVSLDDEVELGYVLMSSLINWIFDWPFLVVFGVDGG